MFEQCRFASTRESCWWQRSVHWRVFGLCCVAGACNRPLLTVGSVGLPVAIVGPVASSSYRSTQYCHVRASRSRSGVGCDQRRSPTHLLWSFSLHARCCVSPGVGHSAARYFVCLHRFLSRVVVTQAGIAGDCRRSTSLVELPTADATSACPRCLCFEGVEQLSTFHELVDRVAHV